MSVSIGEETGGSELPSGSRHATSSDTWPKGEYVTHLATYVILRTFGEGWGGDNDEDYTGTKLRFERWTKPSDLDAKPQYVCYFTSGACNGLFECDVYDYETKFTDFKPLAYDKNMSECRYSQGEVSVEFLDDVLDDQGRPIVVLVLDCGFSDELPIWGERWEEGWGKIYNGETEFSPAEQDRINEYEAGLHEE